MLISMIKGTYIVYENGKEIARKSNVVTKYGKRYFTNFLAGNIPTSQKDMAFGIDTTAATENDTRLGFEFYRTPITLSSTDIQTVNNVTTYFIVYKTTIPQDVVGQINEVGIFPSSRSSVNNFDSKFLADFDNYLDWETSSGANPSVVQSNQKIGDGMLVMASNNNSPLEYKDPIDVLDLSGYSIADTIRLAYYKNDNNLASIKVRLYSSANDYYELTITPATGTGYKITTDIPMSTVFSNPVGSPEKTNINQIGIVVTPTSGNTTSVSMDALRINDEDTFDPLFGLISRAVFGSTLSKSAGKAVDVEYRLELGF